MRSPYRVRHRALRAAIAVALVLGGLVDLLHQATTHHVRCAEHGDLVDTDRPTDDADTTPGADLSLRAGSASHHSHEHCTVLSASPAPGAARAPRVSPVSVARVALASLPPRDVHSSRSLYRTAPKTSPPA